MSTSDAPISQDKMNNLYISMMQSSALKKLNSITTFVLALLSLFVVAYLDITIISIVIFNSTKSQYDRLVHHVTMDRYFAFTIIATIHTLVCSFALCCTSRKHDQLVGIYKISVLKYRFFHYCAYHLSFTRSSNA